MLQPIQLKLTSNQRLINGVAFRWPSPLGGFDMFVKGFLQPQTVKVLFWCIFSDYRDSRWRSNRFFNPHVFQEKDVYFFTQTLNMLWNWTSSEVQLKHTNFRGLTKQPLYLQWSPWEHRPLDRLDSKPSPCPWSPNPPGIFWFRFAKRNVVPKFHHLSKVSSPFQGVSSPFQGGKSLQKFMSFGICKLRCLWPYRLGGVGVMDIPNASQNFVIINLTNPKFHIRKIGIIAFKILKIIKQKIWEQGPTDYHTIILWYFITIYTPKLSWLGFQKNTHEIHTTKSPRRLHHTKMYTS